MAGGSTAALDRVSCRVPAHREVSTEGTDGGRELQLSGPRVYGWTRGARRDEGWAAATATHVKDLLQAQGCLFAVGLPVESNLGFCFARTFLALASWVGHRAGGLFGVCLFGHLHKPGQ